MSNTSNPNSRSHGQDDTGAWQPMKVGPAGDQAVSITNPAAAMAGIYAMVNAFGQLNTATDGMPMLTDTFEAASIDTTVRWAVYGTVAPTVANNALSLAPLTTASATSVLQSQAAFTAGAVSISFATQVALETTAVTGNHRFWGWGTNTSQPGTSAAPLTNGIGFEVDTAGALRASVYRAGTRVWTQALTYPTDGLAHTYVIEWRGDVALFFVDTLDVPTASATAASTLGSMPARFHSLNSGTVSGAPTLSAVGLSVLDNARQGTQIVDGTYPQRKATVSSGGTQAMHISTPTAAALGINATVTGYGNLRVTGEAATLFVDAFDGNIDIQRWTTGGTVAPTVIGGRTSVHAGNTASASSFMASNPTFGPQGVGFLGLALMNRFENVAGAAGAPGYLNSHRFFGVGTAPGTWTTAYTGSNTSGPLLNGIGYEIDTDGYMYAVMYDAGVRTRADAIGQAPGEKRLNLGRTLFNNQVHSFVLVMRSDAVFWYIDGTESPSAVLNYRYPNFPIPDVQATPLRIHTLNSGTVPSGTMVHQVGAIGLGDTGHSHSAVSDATYPWRRSRVDPTGAQIIAGRAIDQAVSVTAAAGQAVTATLPAAGAGLYHYITKLSVVRYATAAITGSATPQVVTTTNMAGTLSFTMPTAAAIGTTTERNEDFQTAPLRAAAANTATTIVAPATTNVIWRINVVYYTAP